MNEKSKKKEQPEIKYIPIDKIRPAPIRNIEFSPGLLEILRKIRFVLREVSPGSFSEWVDSFKRDMYPKREIALWFYMSKVYQEMLNHFPQKLEYKQEVFNLILSCSMEEDEKILSEAKTNFKYLSEDDIKLIIKRYRNKCNEPDWATS